MIYIFPEKFLVAAELPLRLVVVEAKGISLPDSLCCSDLTNN